jgi:hypothetical protein
VSERNCIQKVSGDFRNPEPSGIDFKIPDSHLLIPIRDTIETECRGVAQPGSASALGAEGREFESLRPDQHKALIVHTILTIAATHLLFVATSL